MVTISSLWLAILLSGVIVWIASAIVWMVLPHHKSDYKKLNDEEGALKALDPQNLSPGQYYFPYVKSNKEMKDPEIEKKMNEGTSGYLTVLPKGIPPMGKGMILSFIYYLVIGVFVAYIATRTLSVSTEYLTVFRLTGTVAWLAYGWGTFQDAIWFGRPWSSILKNLLDALIYALLTAGVFGWLWPN